MNERMERLYAPLGIRADIVAAHAQVWQNLARPGNWLTGAERVAIMAETRAAWSCPLCQERKRALSPYGVDGEHLTASSLDPARTDAVHRIVTDPGRLSRRLLDDLTGQGVSDSEYVELLGTALFTLSIDTFHRTLGLELLLLPEPLPGEPRRERPSDLEEIGAWVPVLALRSPLTRELFKGAVRVSNVARGLTLNPHLSRDQVMLVQAQYVPLSEVSSVAESSRAINRAQIELIASRVSALNQCFY